MIAVSLGIPPLHLGVYQALPDHLFRGFLVIAALFFLSFAGHANGFMVEDGEYSRILGCQFLVAPLAMGGTG
jgi:hypothetical protein